MNNTNKKFGGRTKGTPNKKTAKKSQRSHDFKWGCRGDSKLGAGSELAPVGLDEVGEGSAFDKVGACESEPAGRGLLLKTASRFIN